MHSSDPTITPTTDDVAKELQRDVQRLLGRCLLRLQQYERLLKALIAEQHVSVTATAIQAPQADRGAETARKTLGNLVKEFLATYAVTGKNGADDEGIPLPSGGGASLSISFHAEFPEAEYARLTNDLKELVALRNNLVHHFILQHDLWSTDGCRRAQNALNAAYGRIDQSLEMLRTLTEEKEAVRRMFAEYVQTEAFKDAFLNGILHGGVVAWPIARIVGALREATLTMAIEGWTPLEKAIGWIASRYPEQLPEKYGCRSWPQVLQESKVFEIRYFDQAGKRLPFYRERPASKDTA